MGWEQKGEDAMWGENVWIEVEKERREGERGSMNGD